MKFRKKRSAFVIISLLLCFITVPFKIKAQSATETKPAGQSTQTNPDHNKFGTASVHNLTYPLKHDTCLDKKFSIVFYVFLDSIYSPGMITSQTITALTDSINSKFSRICVKFENCSTVYIPNYSLSKWSKVNTEPIVTSVWYTDKTINFYIVDSIKHSPFEANGYTYSPKTPTNLTTPRKDLIVIEKGDIVYNTFQLNLGPTMHQLGHFFGLPHTHDKINPVPPANPGPPPGVISQEYADGSNCQTHGDGFCDTEADPGPFGSTQPNPNAIKDGKGSYYNFPIDNFMTYYGQRCRYTQEQVNEMAYIMITKRLYLH